MSKRNSLGTPSSKSPRGGGGGNTLFNYFSKSPANKMKSINSPNVVKEEVQEQKIDSAEMPSCSKPKILKHGDSPATGKRDLEEKSFEDSEPEVKNMKKRRRIIVNSDSDTENEGGALNTSTVDKEEKEETIKAKKKKIKTQSNDTSLSFQDKLKLCEKKNQKIDEALDDVDEKKDMELDDTVKYKHSSLPFLQPDKIKDKKGRRSDHPDYDPTTLFIPQAFLDGLTPGVRQWWEFKSDNFDCVLFFKVGKFYEFYHMDADIGVKELGFNYMRGDFAHSGFPEISFDKMASTLIERGYKIARVEQTETPDMMSERVKKMSKATKFDKVVRREICQITNKGTRIFGSQTKISYDYRPSYMLAITEKDEGTCSTYGICFIDTSIGDFYIGQFKDDKNCSRLLTLISHNPPVLVLFDKTGTSVRTQKILNTVLSTALKESLVNEKQLWSAEKTLKTLAENYFMVDGDLEWPLTLKIMQDDKDHLGLTAKKEYDLALKCLGGCIWYMKKCLMDQQVLAMSRYFLYKPPDVTNSNYDSELIQKVTDNLTKVNIASRHMVLDSITLSNLKVTGNDSLLNNLDHCCTKFGKRLLHYWVVSPVCDIEVIKARQKAISELILDATTLQDMRSLFNTLPDFERLLAQIHGFGNRKKLENHPDGRAVLFEEKQYNKKKIQNFVSIINGLESLLIIPKMFKNFNSSLIMNLTQKESIGQFPHLEEILVFKEAFNHEEALKTGVIAPKPGIDSEYDSTEQGIEDIKRELNDYLKEQEKYFKCRLRFYGTDKKRYQIEVPESFAKKAGDEYLFESQKKGKDPVRRFHTNQTKTFLKRMMEAEAKRDNVLKDLSRRVFEKFSNHIDLWKKCAKNIAILDVLGSLAYYAKNQNQICVPEVIDNSESPFIHIEDGYHPCISSENFIPNGILLGKEHAPLSLLTGPNMGGKSTLMREVGLLCIMAQIGSHVPATSCSMTVVDRIFTRLGANDDILAGQSTFLVELNETSAIIKHASKHSLVLLDELGRGTATYDGTAIAAAVLQYLSGVKCRALFSTHYHNLVDYFQKNENVTLGHMACMVENEDSEDPTEETVTFLYKYSDGSCPKSYGFNAAKLAGMPKSVIKRAHELSKVMEGNALQRRIISKCFTDENTFELKNLLKQLKSCSI